MRSIPLPPPSGNRKITARRRIFIQEYLRTWNGTQSAIVAGYKIPAVSAYEILCDPVVRAEIEKHIEAFATQVGQDALALLEKFRREQQIKRQLRSGRHGYVYFVRADNGLIKIGKAIDYKQRIARLNSILPYQLEVLRIVYADDCSLYEAELHRRFSEHRVRGEWFSLTEQQISEICFADF